jgi:hypothetical protein
VGQDEERQHVAKLWSSARLQHLVDVAGQPVAVVSTPPGFPFSPPDTTSPVPVALLWPPAPGLASSGASAVHAATALTAKQPKATVQ